MALAAILWLGLLTASLGLLVAALALPTWVTASGVDFGLLVQCGRPFVGASKDCRAIRPDEMTNEYWQAAAALFIVGCLVIIVTLVLGMVALHRNRALLKWAKGCMAVANALVATAAVLVPAGYVLLDDICPAGAHEASCGALCASTGMDYFELCSPYDADLAQWLAVGGAGALFLACFVSVLLPTENKAQSDVV